jgi:alpha-glucosidase
MPKPRLSHPPRFSIAEHDGARVTLHADTGAVAHVFVLEEDIVRVLLLAQGTVTSPPSWAVAPGQEDVAEPGRDRMDTSGFATPGFSVSEDEHHIVVETPRLRLAITRSGFLCTWSRQSEAGWTVISADRPTQPYNFGWWDEATYHYVARQPGERYFGLGERSGPMDRAGRRLRLTNLDPMGYDARSSDPLYKAIPYLLVVAGDGSAHGVFYDTTADPVFDLGQEYDNYHGAYRTMRAESGDLDYYMIAGPDAAEVTRRLTWLTGRPALMPGWALGYSGSTMTYTDAPDAQRQMGQFLAKLEEHDIGCTSFHLSSGYTSIGDKRYVFHWNTDKFPDARGFVRDFAEAGVRLVPNIKPALLRDHPHYADLAAKGWFVKDADGDPIECQFWDELGAYVDFTNPDAAAWWRGQVTAQLLDYGIASTWNDNNEYEIWDRRAHIDGFGAPRPAAAERPVQTLLMMRASRQAQRAHDPNHRPYVVTRSGMAGMQRYAQTWSGDNNTSWESLRFNQKMGLGLALSGVSNHGHDIGGFAGPAPEPELLLRWVQAGILMPRFSIHSWNTDRTVNEPWMYPETTPAIVRLMALRQALIPQLGHLLWRHHAHYEPVTRPLWHDFPSDPAAWTDGDDYLLGPDLLVAPVMDKGLAERAVHCPAGADWFDLRDDRRHAGGQCHALPAPLEGLPPILAREGSGVFLDIAPGGFAPRPMEPAVLLYPPATGTLQWAGFLDESEGWPDASRPPLWRVTVTASADGLDIVSRWDGAAPEPAAGLRIVMPLAETRKVRLNGADAVAARRPVMGVERLLF